MGGKLSSEKSISVGIRCVFHVLVDLDVVALWFPTDVAIDEFGDLFFLYFEIVSRYLDVPVFLDPREPVGLLFCFTIGLNGNSAASIIAVIALDTCEKLEALTDTFTR